MPRRDVSPPLAAVAAAYSASESTTAEENSESDDHDADEAEADLPQNVLLPGAAGESNRPAATTIITIPARRLPVNKSTGVETEPGGKLTPASTAWGKLPRAARDRQVHQPVGLLAGGRTRSYCCANREHADGGVHEEGKAVRHDRQSALRSRGDRQCASGVFRPQGSS